MKKIYLFLLIITLFALLITGCDGFIPSNPNEGYDEENTELAYLKVFPAETEMKVNQSRTFEVKAYNSDDKIILVDVSQIKWAVQPTCWGCAANWSILPKTGSLKTTFTPGDTGYYKIYVNFGGETGKWADADVYVN